MSSVDEYGRDVHRPGRSYSRRSRRERSPTRRRSRSRRQRSRSYRRRASSSQSRSRERSYRHRSRSPLREQPSKFSKQEAVVDLSEDESVHEDDDDRFTSRAKKLKRIDVQNPLSAFTTKTKTRLGHIPASDFAKSNWNTIRGMDPV